MPLSIITVPAELLLLILQKTNPRSLCRFRQTQKWIDHFVEENRFRISVRGNSNLFLSITVTARVNPMAKYHVYNKTTIDCCIFDSYKQLSALHINRVDFETPPKNDVRPQHKNVFFNEIKPTVLKMRIQCEWLNIQSFSLGSIEQVLQTVRFSKLLASYLKYKSFTKWPVTNCDHLHFSFDGTPACLSQLFSNAKSVNICLDKNQHPFKIIDAFLTKVIKDKSVRKNVKTLSIGKLLGGPWGFGPWGELETPEIEKIWKGIRHLEQYVFWYGGHGRPEDIFYKLQIEGGVAVIYQYERCFQLHFIDEGNRKDLLVVLEKILFHEKPYDLSVFYDDFMQSESDYAALKLLCDSFPKS